MSIKPDINLTVDEDIVLWHSISRGDKKAFDDFFMKYYTLLYGYSRYYVSAEDANEVLQELMMWLWENRCNLMEELTLKTLLFTIVKNKALNRISHFEIRRKVHQEITEKFEKEFDNPDFYLENELFRLYENALKQLPKDYREAYEMNRNHRMTHKEIAEKLNVSPQTVNYRIGQALKLLRIALKDYLPLFILYFGLDIFKQS